MKKIITLLSLMLCMFATAQEAVDTMYIYRNDNVVERIPVSKIDSVVFIAPVAPVVPVTPQYEAVDLGLSVKWAAYNVGATKPEEYGGYYAWGETEEKESYFEENYLYYNNGNYTNIGNDISGTQYDVAHVKWGGDWRMPTFGELHELYSNCTWLWITINGINGYKVTGPNGNSIFLPAAGYSDGTDVDGRGSFGGIWSSSLGGDCSDCAYRLGFDDGEYDCAYDDCYRYAALSVRPVCDVTAAPVVNYTVSVLGNENGTVLINGENIASASVANGTEVTVTATANDGYEFVGWFIGDSDTAVSTDATYTFIVAEDIELVAKFEEKQTVNPSETQMTSITDVYGKWAFKADLEVLDAAYADLFKAECEVVIAKGDNGFPAKIIGFAGSEEVMSINRYDLEAGTLCNFNPNTPTMWSGFYMANADGAYPYGEETYYTTIDLTYDAATETLTYPDFTVVSCDFVAGTATVIAKFTNIKLTLTEKEEFVIPEIAGEWTFTPYYVNNDSTFATEFKMTLTAKDDTNTAWEAEFDIEGFDKFTLDATFDGVNLNIPFDNLYLDAEKGIRFGIGATSAAPENVFVKSGVIDFSYEKSTMMYQSEYIYIRQEGVELDNLGNEVAVAPIIQRYFGGWITRKDPNAYDWTGTYTLSIDEDGYLPFGETGDFADEFGTKVVITEYQGSFAISEILGYKIESEYSYIMLQDGDDANSLKMDVAVTGWGPNAYLNLVDEATYSYRAITGLAGAESLDIVLEEDGTITISDFLVQVWTYGKADLEKVALISGVTLVKNDIGFDGADVNSPIKSYTDNLVVTIGGESTEPQETTIAVEQNADGTYTLSLNEFTLVQGEDVIPVGNIVVNNIIVTENNNIKSFEVSQNIYITAGEGNADDWIGPELGAIPVSLKGKMDAANLYCAIDIDVSEMLGQIINVVFGTDF